MRREFWGGDWTTAPKGQERLKEVGENSWMDDPGGPQRRGKWTTEEENYANRLIHEFRLACLPLAEGITLRAFLSSSLGCDPMRISKKFVGHNCIGKQVYKRRSPAEIEQLPKEYLPQVRQELAELERRFIERANQSLKSYNPGAARGQDDVDDEGDEDVDFAALAPQHERGERLSIATRRVCFTTHCLIP